MGLVKRGNVLWVSYAIPKEMAAEFGCPRLVRESAQTGDKREAAKFLAQRKREVREGVWRPAKMSANGLTVETYAARWAAQRVRDGLRSAKRDPEALRPLLKVLGSRRIADVRRADVRKAVEHMRGMLGERGKAKGKPYSPMTIHKSYSVLRSLFGDALREDLVVVNPCTLRTRGGELPPRKDGDPRWRGQAIFTRDEIVMLISEERIPEYRRVLYALLFYGGLRMGEAIARTWSDYDVDARPLGRLHVATQHDERELKTDRPREVPVHPELAKILAWWRDDCYAAMYGKPAQSSDLIVRNTRGLLFKPNTAWENLCNDLDALGLRHRRVHDLRRTMITLARADGAQGELLRWVTHGPSRDILDVYTTPTWEALCSQVSCIRVSTKR